VKRFAKYLVILVGALLLTFITPSEALACSVIYQNQNVDLVDNCGEAGAMIDIIQFAAPGSVVYIVGTWALILQQSNIISHAEYEDLLLRSTRI